MTLRVENRVPGWRLHAAHLDLEPGSHEQVLGVAIRGAVASLLRRFPDGLDGDDAAVRSVRDALGCSGCRTDGCAPSSERLAERFLGGESPQRSFPAREFRDILTLRMMLPWGAMDAEDLRFPLIFRLGEAGEGVDHEGGRIDLQGVPVLTDGDTILSSPCTTHDLDRLSAESKSLVLVSYTPFPVWRTIQARTTLSKLIWMTWAYTFVEERAFKPLE